MMRKNLATERPVDVKETVSRRILQQYMQIPILISLVVAFYCIILRWTSRIRYRLLEIGIVFIGIVTIITLYHHLLLTSCRNTFVFYLTSIPHRFL